MVAGRERMATKPAATERFKTPCVTHGANPCYAYDRMGRRVAKNNQRFVYDGYLQIANFVPITKGVRYNEWEYNVAKRGLFVGYLGSVSILTEPIDWVIVNGKNVGESR